MLTWRAGVKLVEIARENCASRKKI